MKNDFSKPQRQSLLGIVIMFGDTLQGSIRALAPILIITILRPGSNKIYVVSAIFGIVLVATLVIGYLKYLNFTFFLDQENEEFVVRKGILNKTRIAVPLDKIQQVNINQSLLQKLVKVHALEVDTAGSNSKEITIKAITHAHALSLKEMLLEGDKAYEDTAPEAAEARAEKQHPFIEISLMSLLKTGITSNYLRSFGILLAFFISTFQHIDDFIRAAGYDQNPLDDYLDVQLFFRFVALFVLAIMFLVLMINLGRTIIRYYNFRITKQKDSLLLSYGLINTRNTIIRPEKVQMVATSRNFFQKKFNINDLRIRQASDLESNGQDQHKSAMEIPGCDNAEKDMLLKFLLGKVPEKGEMVKPNIRKLILGCFKALVIPVGIYLVSGLYLTPVVYEYIYIVPFYVVMVSLLLFFGFKNYRLFVNNDFVIKQSGGWDIDTEYIAPHKIHTIKTTQYFWQKGSDVGTIILYTAGGKMSFGVANFTKLKSLVNNWLSQVETTTKHWM
jgi:putative membrane protein